MDKRFNTENFEKSLKIHTDDFKMMPSKKVWRGIYNDLQPGTRWPSVAMSLVFIFTLVIIGHLNTNNAKILAALNTPGKITAQGNISGKNKHRNHTLHYLSNYIKSSKTNIDDNSIEPISKAGETVSPPFQQGFNNNSADSNVSNSISNSTDIVRDPDQSFPAKKQYEVIIKNDDRSLTNSNNADNNFTTATLENTNQIADNYPIVNDLTKENFSLSNKASDVKQQIGSTIKESATKQEEKSAGTFIFSKKTRDKMSVTYYVSPSISYRNLTEKSYNSYASQYAASGAALNFSSTSVDKSVINKPIIGLEVGGALNYRLSKKLQFTTGLQLNYAGYNIKANYVHPVSTTLLLVNDYTGNLYGYNSISNYGNGSSSSHVTLHQYSFQVSAPFGLKSMIAEIGSVQLNAEATFQPSYIFANKAYLLSGDKRNYVTDPSLLRSLNMSTNLGTFVSFKSNTFNWQIGPQVFYQVLSTYSRNYPIQEHLVNYGIRFGVSKLKK